MLTFHTPFTVKYQGEFIRDLQMDPIIASIRRRLYMLDCFEGIEAEIFWDETPETAVTTRQQSRLEGVNRYSNRRDSAMTLRETLDGKFITTSPDTLQIQSCCFFQYEAILLQTAV